jgi:serine/threonine protein kinase/tetratricopeptide (TPR) repeat protein
MPLAPLVERLAEEMAERWRACECPLVEEYLARHPELLEQAEAALELIAEEMQLRQEAGQEAEAAEFMRRFPQWRRQVQALADCHQLLGTQLDRLRFPAPGEALGDFHLLAELGRGAHGRVFLATQPALADRPVVLKLAPNAGHEHLSLSRLQHTHIVPLYSVHDFPERGLRGLCQPYFGGLSLADLLRRVADRPASRRTGRDLLQALEQAQATAPAAVPVNGPACRFLARASYVDVVCWMGACLADALHYAQERGLLHLDLKPSNVLFAADGQPMLLDFHLACAPLAGGTPAPASLGGTPGYMAPEHLAALAAVSERGNLPAAVDGRADVYALGVLLYEVLGGTVPVPPQRPAAALRRRNPQVTSGLADLLARCLAPDPANRYGAAELAADLRRNLADLPLQGVANRNPLERWHKWRRRRPHALPLVGLLLAGVLVSSLYVTHLARQTRRAETALREGEQYLQHQHHAQAVDAFRGGVALAEDLPVRGRLLHQLQDSLREAERGQAADALHLLCERIRPLYGADFLPAEQARAAAAHCRNVWQQRALISARLGSRPAPAVDQQLQADLLELAIVWAHLHVRLAAPTAARAAHQEALEALAEAEALFGPSCVLYQERRTLALALGLADMADAASRRGAALPPRSAWEHYALGRAYLQVGDLRRATELIERSLELQPQATWPNFYKGLCAYRLGQYEDALLAFTACAVLVPHSAACFYNRGRAFAELGRLDRALHDYDHALQLDPTLAAAALSRAEVYRRQQRYDQALADLQRARRDGIDEAVVSYQAALVHLGRRDPAAARASLHDALRHQPGHQPSRELLGRLPPPR